MMFDEDERITTAHHRHSGERISLDRYYTPSKLARATLIALNRMEPVEGVVLEPGAGAGAFALAVLDLTSAKVIVGDIDSEAPALNMHLWEPRRSAGKPYPAGFLYRQDFLAVDWLRPAWVIGNPPYLKAEAHVRHALAISQRVVFLLRSSFASSKRRIPFWAEHPPRHVWQLAQRPSFTGGGTDNSEYSVFFWDQGWEGPSTFTPGWDWKSEE